MHFSEKSAQNKGENGFSAKICFIHILSRTLEFIFWNFEKIAQEYGFFGELWITYLRFFPIPEIFGTYIV